MEITGNADPDLKEIFSDLYKVFGPQNDKPSFAQDVLARLKVTHASKDRKADEPHKEEARVVCEIVVSDGMLNGGGTVHGGCSAFLIDMCSSLAFMVFGQWKTVSQSLNVVYHSPAATGETLRVINTTLTMGARTMSARTEIWNVTKHRLVASGVHIKMAPSSPKL